MSLTAERFAEFFRAIYSYDPFPWQVRLADNLVAGRWPDCIDLPTATGKTSVIDIAVFTLACQAALPTEKRTVGRRIFFAVNRRVIVDEAYERAVDLAKGLQKASAGILKEVADALRAIGGEAGLPLDVAQLRGGTFRDSAWARSIVQPTVVCTTADQLGSRLLFRGYGVSPRMQPVHAALTACDSLVLLDEAHVTKAFAQTLRLLQRYQQHKPGLRFIEMTATPSDDNGVRFGLDDDDLAHPVLCQRQQAGKPATLAKVPSKSLVAELTKRAIDSVDAQRKAVGIIVNRVQTARDVHAKLAERFGADAHLVIGRMRPLDRDDLQRQLRALVGTDRRGRLELPVFIVATQCLEVGADYDFDVLVTECASIDALRQRFGRLNRKGRPIQAIAHVVTNDAVLKESDPVYGEALKHTWEWLFANKSGDDTVDFGIAPFKKLWDKVDAEQRLKMTNLTPDAAVLLPAHLDALCQTSPQPIPSPDVSYFIHGPQRDNADVEVCWRADLGDDPSRWAEIVSLLPPTSPECMTVPIRAVRRWMQLEDAPVDADVPLRSEEPERRPPTSTRTVLLWRGARDASPISDPKQLRPGDTLVIAAPDSSSLVLGHLPQPLGTPAYDLAERSIAAARRQRIVRVHPSVHPELLDQFKNHASGVQLLSRSAIRARLGGDAADFTAGPTEIEYPHADDQPPPGIVFRFTALLPSPDAWKRTEVMDEGDADESSESTRPLLLARHVADVMRYTDRNVRTLGLHLLESLFSVAAARHDDGKNDLRFHAMLAGTSPYEAIGRPALGKSGERGTSRREQAERSARAMLPAGFRHEMLSMQIVDDAYDTLVKDASIDRNLLLHLVAAHHGHARPFAPIVIDAPDDEQLLGVRFDGGSVEPRTRELWIPAHRLDSGVAERFWDLTREHGWWGLAYLEAILRLADMQASAAEQERNSK